MEKIMTAIFLLFSFVACGDKTEDTGEEYTEENGFAAGSFQFTNQSVADQCLDGGFNVLFLPDSSPNDWQNEIELPSETDLPSSYDIELQAPFSTMAITVSDGGDGVYLIEEAIQEGVLFDEASYANCVVDLSIEATINLVDDDNVNGIATLSVVSYEGDTCPAFASEPCDIELDFTGVRQ
jgi:hypothetical protein